MKRFSRIAVMFLLTALAIADAVGASADSSPQCAVLENWLQWSGPFVPAESRAAEWKVRHEAARNIFKSYLSGTVDFRALESCLELLPRRENFMNTLHSVFLEESLQWLERNGGSKARAFCGRFREQTRGKVALFKLMAGFKEDEILPSGLSAAFMHGRRAVLMDLARIQPTEWFLILIHELSHFMDPELVDASARFAEGQESAAKLKRLNPVKKKELIEWLEAGLNLGLFAEYRAWHETLAVYEDGLMNAGWTHVPWADEILATQRKCDSSLEGRIFHYLNERFENPTDGVFASPLIQEVLSEVRASYGCQRLPGNRIE